LYLFSTCGKISPTTILLYVVHGVVQNAAHRLTSLFGKYSECQITNIAWSDEDQHHGWKALLLHEVFNDGQQP
jgi:hypothetical protein